MAGFGSPEHELKPIVRTGRTVRWPAYVGECKCGRWSSPLCMTAARVQGLFRGHVAEVERTEALNALYGAEAPF